MKQGLDDQRLLDRKWRGNWWFRQIQEPLGTECLWIRVKQLVGLFEKEEGYQRWIKSRK